jgi:hypothetical protein
MGVGAVSLPNPTHATQPQAGLTRTYHHLPETHYQWYSDCGKKNTPTDQEDASRSSSATVTRQSPDASRSSSATVTRQSPDVSIDA